MRLHEFARYLWLALPGLIGAVGLGIFLEPTDWLRILCLSLLGPYLLGASKLYEAYAIRKTQRALLVLVPAALQVADRVIPGLLKEGGNAEDLKEAVRKELATMTRTDWGEVAEEGLLEGADFDALAERVVGEMRRSFDPFTLLDKAGSIGSGGIVPEPSI